MISSRVYVSTACVTRHFASLPDLLVAFTAAGIDRLEFGHSPRLGSFSPAIDLPRFAGRALLHNYFPPPAEEFVLNLASQNLETLRRSRDFCAVALHYAAMLQAPFFSVHCGFLAEFAAGSLGRQLEARHVVPYEIGYATFCASLRELLPVAEKLGVRFLLEPNVIAPFNLVAGRNELLLLVEPFEFRRLLAEFPQGSLGVLLDLGHLKVTSCTLKFRSEEFVDVTASRIGAFHLHDNDGTADQHRPVEDEWMLALLRRREYLSCPVIVEAVFPSVTALANHACWLSSAISN